MTKKLAPCIPRILLEDFLRPLGYRSTAGQGLSVPPRRINESSWASGLSVQIRHCACAVLRTSDRFWLNLQAAHDLDVERDRLAGRLRRKSKVLRKAS